jgi:uncharacterized membrane protein YjjB (DUF3815 family)
MSMDYALVLHQTVFGGLAALGFGVLFNLGPRSLVWCALCGATALAVRSAGLERGWSLEASSFSAALIVGVVVQLLRRRIGVSRNTLGVAGCIPMVPGGFAAKAILGLFALTSPTLENPDSTLIQSLVFSLRVVFTIGAIATGLAMPTLLLRLRK